MFKQEKRNRKQNKNYVQEEREFKNNGMDSLEAKPMHETNQTRSLQIKLKADPR